jgi:hypothetical protein
LRDDHSPRRSDPRPASVREAARLLRLEHYVTGRTAEHANKDSLVSERGCLPMLDATRPSPDRGSRPRLFHALAPTRHRAGIGVTHGVGVTQYSPEYYSGYDPYYA